MSAATAPERGGPLTVKQLEKARERLAELADDIIEVNREYLGLDQHAIRDMADAAGCLIRARVRLHAQVIEAELAAASGHPP